MQKAYLMGNEAIGLGALAAGVNFVSGYPGTPSTEVLETIARRPAAEAFRSSSTARDTWRRLVSAGSSAR